MIDKNIKDDYIMVIDRELMKALIQKNYKLMDVNITPENEEYYIQHKKGIEKDIEKYEAEDCENFNNRFQDELTDNEIESLKDLAIMRFQEDMCYGINADKYLIIISKLNVLMK